MEQQQALGVLIQAVNLAQSRGAYNLQEASTLAEAVSVFVPPQPEEEPTEALTESVETPAEETVE